MPIPQSLIKAGYLTAEQVQKRRGLMIGTEGPANSGKTEFILSAPGAGGVICVDRGFDNCLKNPTPPQARHGNFAFRIISVPLAGTATQADYAAYWKSFREEFYNLLGNNDIRTVGLDGDSDTWELQRLAAFGKLTQIPSIMYTEVNASRRALITKANDSGKIVIATNKVKKEYVDKVGDDGQVVMKDGKSVRVASGDYERQGFSDHEYLWAIQLQHIFRAGTPKIIKAGPRAGETIPGTPEWGIKFLMCKSRMELVGSELWGDKCNFAGVVQLAYPQIPLSEWGL